MTSTSQTAVRVLADGSVFRGRSIGAPGTAVGEVVFNTAMTGYQEILTDPSYCRQIVTKSYVTAGTQRVRPEDLESGAGCSPGLVVRDLPLLYKAWMFDQSIASATAHIDVVAIADIDTRKLT